METIDCLCIRDGYIKITDEAERPILIREGERYGFSRTLTEDAPFPVHLLQPVGGPPPEVPARTPRLDAPAGPEVVVREEKTPLEQAVSELDPENDDHWTRLGSVRLDSLGNRIIALGGSPVTRSQLDEMFPGLKRR